MHGLTLDRVFVKRGISGSKPLAEHPEGAALLASLRPGDTVVIAKLDRMFRSSLDALDVLGQAAPARRQLAHDRPRRRDRPASPS